ncbi:acyl-CoA dehydrogenase family protein [Siccirubricoccus sp. G192]|uniref:acyl-CoA dehydrogenase family protein n=1 Tax=Siccirubricoccus sp. G192 TaxID=2849651 RepID=UPI001C2B98B6|nr:acyl-CoA dehydrogenase family protein [Siccirubricoccus sp. G192]MBV1798851.1 acyl-CoA dehydrogenase family protein [Siccirubricoccus sp. G192]
MSDTNEDLRGILLEQVERLLTDRSSPNLLRATERGEWPAALWAEVEALGLPLALVPEAMGGVGLGWADAVAVWQVLGRHAAPLPLAESMAAAALLAAAGITPPAGLIALALPGEATAWGRQAGHVAAVQGGEVTLHAAADLTWQPGRSLIGREPADQAMLGEPLARGRVPAGWGADAGLLAGALLQAAKIAGALEAALDMTVDYAKTRKQFGRPIGGFQAVQQQLAVCAAEVAACGVAAAQAGRAADRRGLAGAEFRDRLGQGGGGRGSRDRCRHHPPGACRHRLHR